MAKTRKVGRPKKKTEIDERPRILGLTLWNKVCEGYKNGNKNVGCNVTIPENAVHMYSLSLINYEGGADTYIGDIYAQPTNVDNHRIIFKRNKKITLEDFSLAVKAPLKNISTLFVRGFPESNTPKE